jgi:hypothetical protein
MSIKNKIDYCRLHNIEIFYNMAHLDAQMAGFWAKLPLIRKLMLGHPQVEWIWWMDSDAMFTDMLFEVPLEKYEKYNLVMHGFDELVFKEKSWTGLNTGSFLIRNCQWSLDLLDAWAPMGPKGIIREKAGKKKKKIMKKIMCLCLCFFVPSFFFNSSSNLQELNRSGAGCCRCCTFSLCLFDILFYGVFVDASSFLQVHCLPRL